MKESKIVHKTGVYWVADADNQYTVYRDTDTHAKACGSYQRTPDGLSLAKYHADYLNRRPSKAPR